MTRTEEKALLAGGCFWGMQELIRTFPGVLSTRVGYSGGDVPHATYRNHGTHAESIEITYDPAVTDYRTILEYFFQIHDPSTVNRQGNDIGTSYRSAIFYFDDEQKRIAEDTIADVDASGLWPGKVVTEVAPAGPFWEAEPEHQDYLQRYPDGYTCHFVRPGWRLPTRAEACAAVPPHAAGARPDSRACPRRAFQPRWPGPGRSAELPGHVAARGLLVDDVDPVVGVDQRDEGHERHELVLVVVPGGVRPDRVGDPAGPVGEAGALLGQLQGRALSLGEDRGLPPDGHQVQPLVALPGRDGVLGVHVRAEAAAVDLAGPDLHQLLGGHRQPRIGQGPARRVDVLQYLGREGVAEEVDTGIRHDLSWVGRHWGTHP